MARLVPPRREFILRSAGHMRYFGVGRFGQISFIVLAVLLVGWVGFSSLRYVSNALVVAERNVRIATSDRVIRSMQEEIDGLKREIERGDRSLDQQAAAKEEIASQNSSLRNQIASLEDERDRLSQDRDDRDRVVARLNGRIGDLTGEQTDLVDELKMARGALQATVGERARVVFERSELNERVAMLSDRLELFEASQSQSINRLGETAEQGISALERTLVVAGLDIPLMLERVLGERLEFSGGVGGPLLVVDDEPGSETGEKLAEVEQRLLKLQGLQGLMKHLPFAAPLNEFRLTSGFGRRRDPFTNQLAMHPGQDFASRNKNPIHVTAPGTVAFVGWKGGYGKVVEVDHGFGIRTRFAHMSRIYVKRGQKLEFREKVGLVGSTGRSTAPHLHYEVMVDGRQLDPANFLRAGQYVYKN